MRRLEAPLNWCSWSSSRSDLAGERIASGRARATLPGMKLLQLFDTLVPSEAGEVKDLLGNVYPIPVAVSARKAIAASRLLRKVLEATISESAAGNKLELGTALNFSSSISAA